MLTKLWPQTMAGRTLILLFAGLLFSHAVSLWIYSGDRLDALAALGGRQITDRIVATTAIIEETPPQLRIQVLRRAGSHFLHGLWSNSPFAEEKTTDSLALNLKSALEKQFNGVSLRVSLSNEPPTPRIAHMMKDGRFDQWAIVSVGLKDGSWLNFIAPVETAESLWRPRFALAISGMAAVFAALCFWAVRKLTFPLSRFTAAAIQLGKDFKAQPLAEAGPLEVKEAAVAFNEMQRGLNRFVSERIAMLAAISHDLRTPITRMRLRAEFIEDEEIRNKTLADLEEMEAMIKSTLNFAKDEKEGLKKEKFDLAAMLQELCADLPEASYEGLESMEFYGDYLALKRAFGNLCDNAIKYGKKFVVKLEPNLVEITDEGPGIPETEQEKVFAPFYRLDSSRSRETGGVGLGLAVASQIIQAHKGRITLENLSPQGLKVKVYL